MTSPNLPLPQGGFRRALNKSLLGSASLLVLMLTGPGEARDLTSAGSAISATAAAQQAAMAAAQQAAGAANQAQASLARAAAALAAARKVQQDAAAAAQAAASASSVRNGLGVGGLLPGGGTADDPLAGIKADLKNGTTTTWLAAGLPMQTTTASGVTVDITQTQSRAILNWQTFNVGAKTTVNFNQSGTDWIALNRVTDPTGSPSQILGHINAIGTVYVINRNGIIFGAGSQINTHSLIASTLDVGKLGNTREQRDDFFVKSGIAGASPPNSFSIFDDQMGAQTTKIGGDIVVAPGASITTSVVSLDDPGFIYLFGANVTNAGRLSSPAGEVALVAARAIDLVSHGYSVLPTSVVGLNPDDATGQTKLPMNGTEFRISPFAASYAEAGKGIPEGYPTSFSYLAGTGQVRHEGLIETPRGNTVMEGDRITIGSLHADPTDPSSQLVHGADGNLVRGVISADTSIGRNSLVLLRAATSVDMNGVISSLPYNDGTQLSSGSTTGSTVQSFRPAYIEMSAQAAVTLGSDALISAPSAYVALRAINLGSANSAVFTSGTMFTQGGLDATASNIQAGIAGQQVLLQPGATIDVAGLENVELPASYNYVSFQPRGLEFADMPLQRNGALFGQTLYFDIRSSGTRSDQTTWVGTPLADASGYVAKVGRSIDQLMTTGGTVALTTDLVAPPSGGLPGVTQSAGSVINVAGGSVKFLPGTVPLTRLIGADGRIYSMDKADPNMTYVGLAGQFTVDHSHWNVKETWYTGTTQNVAGYAEGHDAGSLTVTTVTASLQGTTFFGSVAGDRQIASGQLPLQGSLALTTPSSVVIGAGGSNNFASQSQVQTTLLADTLSGYGLSALTVKSNDFALTSGSSLSLAAGGSLSVTAGLIDVAGDVTANGGKIKLTTDQLNLASGEFSHFFKAPTATSGGILAANIYVEGALDVSGRFVNDTGRFDNSGAGPAFIDGGSISLTTNKNSNGIKDTTGSIKLAAGSSLDVSSGGYISPQGKPKTTSAGIRAGKAGSISLKIYQGYEFVEPSASGVPIRPTSGSVATIQLDGALRGYGFENNGSLTLGSVDTLRIGGALQTGEASSIWINGKPSVVPVSLFNDGGFGSYTLQSISDDWTGASARIIVSAGTGVKLQQQNLSSFADFSQVPTGGKPTVTASLPDNLRQPVNLTLKADNILLDQGASIETDPKAKITITGSPNFKGGSEQATAASQVLLLGRITDHGGTVSINAQKTWLGSQARIDLSGTVVANYGFGTVNAVAASGMLLAGGTFSVDAADPATTANPSLSGSYVVAESGAVVDVSGYAGAIQIANSGATSSVWSWSDAGTVSINSGALLWGGSFLAKGGVSPTTGQSDSRANGGTILLGGGNVTLAQDSQPVIDALNAVGTPSASGNLPTLASNPSLAKFDNVIYASVRRSSAPSGSGSNDALAAFDNIYLYSGSAYGGAARIFNDLPGNFYGSVAVPALGVLSILPGANGTFTWDVANRLHIAASTIGVASNQASDVKIDAPYVLLTGGGGGASSGKGSLTVTGQTIDVVGAAFQGFSNVALKSSGDLRLGTPKVVDGVADPSNAGATLDASRFAGKLVAGGDLLLSAQRIYPISAVDFTIQTPGKVTFAAPADSHTQIPLSAGGSLTVWASTILQNGNLFAPLGKITLGNLDSTVSSIITSQVTLGAGSLTSVSLADTVVPYGATSDGAAWYYNASVNPLATPPSKGLVLAGTNVVRGDGSTIDLRGGGDLQAMEWIQGRGGSRDTLTTTPAGQTVYALVPSTSDAIAAFDIHFATARNGTAPGDTIPLPGTQITIAGGNGIPAGTYTLYPAHYATLPGAMRVVYYGDNTAGRVANGTKLPDGTVLVSGNYTQSTVPGKQSSGSSLFAIQTETVWKQYSEFSLNGANSFFTQLARKQNAVVPRLPMDAGRLSVIAQQTILLNGVALTQPGRDSSGNLGRGGELDISAPQLAVVGHADYAKGGIPAGYVGLDVAQLNGFDSILIGGQRSDTSKGTLITPTASNVLVDTDGEALTAPEILLVAQVAKPTQLQGVPQDLDAQGTGGTIAIENQIYAPSPTSGVVKIAAGSIVQATGTVNSGAGRSYYFADPKADFAGSNGKATTAQDIATALGGTLDASGTVITGADLSKLSYFLKNADGSFLTNPDGSLYRHGGTIGADGLSALQNYSYQTTGLGAMFVATNDSTLKVSGPSGVAPQSLTIRFAATADPRAAGVVGGEIVLPADAGRVAIESGVSITSKVLTLQATASTSSVVANSNDLHLGQLNIVTRTIGLGPAVPVFDKSAVLFNQQFADVKSLSLKSLSGVITMFGDYNPGAVTNLTLDTAKVVRAEGAGSSTVSVASGGTVQLINSSATTSDDKTVSPANNSYQLTVDAANIVLGGGDQSILGFGGVNLNASNQLLVAGVGSMTLGATGEAVDLHVSTPSILVASASGAGGKTFAFSTSGNFNLDNGGLIGPIPDRPTDSAEINGSVTIKAASIAVDSIIQAQAGSITLQATSGDVGLGSGARLAAGGYVSTLVDVTTYVAGGKVVLQADSGNVAAAAGSIVDVSQPALGQGYGGEINVAALGGTANLAGVLRGGGGSGLGGRFKLDTKGAVDLTTLADTLLTGGVTGAIDIHTRTGNLVLAQGHTLKANAVTLTADDKTWSSPAKPSDPNFGQVIIAGRIDASGYAGKTLDGTGQAGGQVALYGANQVLLTGSSVIDASTAHTDERGGDVTIGIAWAASGKILLQTGALIDVSGGSKGGLSGGTVTFRAPRDGNDDAKIAAIDGAGNELPTIQGFTIKGARAVNVESYVAFDTTSSSAGLDGSTLGWTGIIDPAGWYNPDGSLATSGAWTNITGWQISGFTTNIGFRAVPNVGVVSGGGGSNATAVAVMGVNANQTGFFNPKLNAANPSNSVMPANSSGIPVVFPTPPGGVAAKGTASTDAAGVITITITDPGSGYTSIPTSVTIGGAATSLSGGSLQVVSVTITSQGNKAYDTGSAPTITFTGLGANTFGVAGNATASFSQGSNLAGTTANNVFTPATPNYLAWKSSGVFQQFDPSNLGSATFVPDTPNGKFFGTTLPQVVSGLVRNADGSFTKQAWAFGGKSYGFDNLFNRLQPLVSELGADVVHVQPGVELVNSTGSITVKDNWNLAAVWQVGGLQTATNALTGATFQYFDPAQSYANFIYRLATPWGGLDAGALTLRAKDDIKVNASISDGFLQTGNYLDPNYQNWVASYVSKYGRSIGDKSKATYYPYYLSTASADLVPIAPYNAGGNVISPTAKDLAVADLFPHSLNVCTIDCSQGNVETIVNPSSWTYRLAAGIDASAPSANPVATISLANALKGNGGNGTGSVIVDQHTSYSQGALVANVTSQASSVSVNLPTMVRTGTGSIDVAAALDVKLADQTAPGVIYAAGVNTAKAANPYSVTTTAAGSKLTVVDPDGFFEPQVLTYGNDAVAIAAGSTIYGGPPTAAAFPQNGGDVTIDAQHDVIGYSGSGNKTLQYYQPWLLAVAGLTPANSAASGAAVSLYGAGVFTPSGTGIASQTAWWIQYGSFDQGILSAGGNVTVAAGHNLVDVSVSLPTTGRVSGGLSANSVPVTHLYGSGNMVVRAGGDILGGSFYEGSGHASIIAGGSLGQNATISRFASSKLQLADVPLLAVDTGQISVTAGAIAIAGVINPAALNAQSPTFANPLEQGTPTQPLYMTTYGPDSKVRAVATTGDLTISIAPTAIRDGTAAAIVNAAPSTYPASFEALALNGSLVTTGIAQALKVNGVVIPMPGIVLSPSEQGTFELLARNNVDLTFGYPDNTFLLNSTPRPFISAGPALLDAAFDPFQPNFAIDGLLDSNSRARTNPVLAHKDDTTDTTARIYAATGDIKGTGTYGARYQGDAFAGYQRAEFNRPTKIYAGHDVVDLNMIVQNIHPSDVSSVVAGNDIYYTGYNNAGGLQVAGPGFFVVQAGGNLGPFLPAAHDLASQAVVQEGIASVGNGSTTPVGDIYIQRTSGGSVGLYNAGLYGPISNPRRNTLLTAEAGTNQGADLIVLFGAKYGADYQAVIDTYIDPSNATNIDHNYLTELRAFLARIGIATSSEQDAWNEFINADKLPVPPVSQDLKQVFVDQVFFAELNAVATSKLSRAEKYPIGFKMINTMFPASLGYTDNPLDPDVKPAQLVRTGDLNLLHATIQSRLGGDISIFGPGGSILVGPLAIEPNPNLKLRDLGILSLGGGAIRSFTDGNVQVNSSRVLTTQGGDILMWTSNGDLDAGRGSKTTVSQPPLQVQFDSNDYQTVDPGGYVSGAGIGTLQASPKVAASPLRLLTPRGSIDLGDAGARSSGDVLLDSQQCFNCNNLAASGQVTITAQPNVSVNVGALTSGSNTAGAAAKSADTPTAGGGNQNRATILIVEVVGYGDGGNNQDAPSGNENKPSDGPSDNSRKKDDGGT
ncbi:filamentous haemagglutinin family protein [Bradyrhizobium sp. WSM3983]|uniref:filamentous haemagglutinin family protein n=1 Tax=Bradyrhizobium sp. WSM3983 TaxID=1038867 RepID=UPI0004102C0A|nr:filamentous haemagglutinin family protein [Bradyrhizobium sp. WSM3983]